VGKSVTELANKPGRRNFLLTAAEGDDIVDQTSLAIHVRHKPSDSSGCQRRQVGDDGRHVLDG